MPKFSMRIAKESLSSKEEPGIKSIIVIQHPYAHLEKELRSVFKGQEDIKIILERRLGERRKKPKAVAVDRRKAERRSPKEDLVQVVISA